MNAGNIHVKILADAEAMYREFAKIQKTAQQAAESVRQAFGNLAGALAGGFSAKAFIDAADAVTTLNNQLKLATGSMSSAASAYNELFQIAQRSRISFTELGGTFASISRAGAELGLSQQRLLGVTEAIGNAMTVSGGSAASMNAALVQLGQGLSSGTLRGEELNSVMEQTPRLATALADGLGVTTGQLREMGAEGKLTAEAVVKALESQAAVLRGEVADSAMTVGQAMTQLKNAAVVTAGDLDAMTGISSTLAGAISGLSGMVTTVGQAMKDNEGAIKTTLGALGGAGVAAGVTAVGSAIMGAGGPVAAIAAVRASFLGLTATMAANPVGLALLGIGAVGGAVLAMNKGPDLSSAEGQARELERTVKRLADAEALLDRAGGAGQGQMTAQLEARIAGLKKYRDELSAGQTQDKAITEAMRADEKQWTAEHRKATAEAEASTKRLTDIKNELFKVDTKYIGKLQELAAQRNAGNLSEAEYVKLVKMAVDANAGKEKSSTKLSAAVKAQAETEKEALKGLELYSNLIAETAGFQGDYAEKVSQLAEAYAANKISLEGFTFAHEKLLQKQPAAVEATKMEAEARKVLADAVTASARAYEEAQQAMDSQVQSLWQSMNAATQAGKDEAEALQFELSLMGKSAEARTLEIEQNKIRIKLKRELAAIEATPFEDESQRLAARVQAEENAAREMANAGLRVQLESQKTIESEWRKTADQIQQSLTDALMRGFESGKGFLENLRDSVVNMFKTMVLRPVISAVMSPITAGLSGALGLAGAAQAGQGVSAIGAVGTGASIYNTVAGAGTLAGGFMNGLSAWGAGGSVSGVLGNAGLYSGAELAGALAPIAAGALVFANAVGLFRKTTVEDVGIKGSLGYDSDLTLFDRMRKSGTLFSGPDYWDRDKEMDPKLAQALDTQVRAIYTAGEQYAAALGLTADGVRDITREIRISTEGLTDAQVQEKLQAEFTALGETIAQSLLGTTQTITETVKEMQLVPADDDMGMVYQEVEKTITRVVAVQSEYARTGETSAQTLTRLAGSLTVVNSAFDMLGLTMLQASLASGDYASQLVDAVGGGDAFAQAAGSFFENYYTEAEKAAYQTELITKELASAGLTMPKTRAEFKAMVEAQRALGPAGKDGLAALLRVNGAFAQLVPAADEAAGAVTSFFDSLAEGVSGQIEDVLTNVLMGKADGATAGAELAAAVVGGVQQAIISGTTSVIAETFTSSIIAPIIANVAAGRAAMEGVDLQGAIAAAGAQMQALQAVLTSPEVAGGFASITGALNNLVGAAQGAAAGINGAIGGIGTGYTPGLFAIGGSATSTVYRPQEPLRPLVDFTSLQQETLEVNKSVAKLLEEYLNKDETPVDRYEALAEQLADRRIELNISGYEQQISGLTSTITDVNATLAQFNPLIAQFLRGYEVIGDETSGYLRKIAEMIVVRQGDKLNSGFLNGTPLAGGVGYENQSMVDRVLMTIEGTLQGLTSTGNEYKFTEYLLMYLGIPANTLQLENDLSQRIEQLASLEKDLREWYLAQSRLIAIEEATALEKETKDAKARTDELRRTGGLEDPVTKLREQFREKMESMNAGIGAALRAEIETLKTKTADTTDLQKVLDRQKQYMGQVFDQTGSPLQSYVDDIQRQIDSSRLYLETVDHEALSAAILESITSSIFDSQQLLARIHDGSLFAELQAGIAGTEQAILDAMLAATEPAKQQELLDEIARYEGGITEWFKAQAELLSTEMLVDINAQIRELEKADQGPLTAIKAGIQKYIDDLKALDQLTPEAQATIDKLSNLQLTQTRGDLEAQLLSKPELEARDLSALTANFAALGQQLPATAADFKALLATITDPAKRDALLELIPAFVALRPPLEGAAAAAETVQQAYDRLKAVTRTNEDIARERIDLEARLAAATQTQAQALEAARNAIDPYNRALYDQVVAAEAARALAQTQKEATSERLQADIRLAQAQGNTALVEQLQRQAFIAGLEGLTAAQQAAKIEAYDYAKAIDAQIAAMQSANQAAAEAKGETDKAMAEVRRLIQAEVARLQESFKATDAAMAALDRAEEARRTIITKQLEAAKATEASVKGIFDALRNGARELRGEVDSTAAMQAQQARDLIRNAIATGVLPDQKVLDEAIGATRAGLEAQVYASEKDAEFAKLVLAGELEKLQDIAQPQLSAAEQAVVLAEEQLAALEDQVKQAKAMVDGIRGVDGRVLTVGEAVAELQTAAAAETLARGQIDKLQLQLEEAEKSYNELRGIKTGVDAIAPALQALADAIAGEKSAAAQAAALAAAAAAQRQAITNAASGQYGASVEYVRGFGETSAMADTTYANQREADIAALYQNVLGRVADSGGLAYYAGTGLSIAEIAASLEASREDDIRDAYGAAAQQAFNDQVNAALGLESDIRVRGFATGGYYPGGLALVGEEGPELINFAQPGQVYTAPQTRELLGGMGGSERMAGLMGEMAQEIRSLRAEVVELRRSADKGNEHTAVIAQAHEGRGQAPLLVEIAQ